MQTTGSNTSIDVANAWNDVGARLRAFAYRRVPPPEGEDIVQSVMLKLLERRAEVGPDSVRAWLFAVTRNAVAEYYRRKPSTVDVEDLDAFAADALSDPADRALGALTDCLDPMLALLSPADAEILRRVDLEGEAQVDIARALGVSASTVKSRVQRARLKLREKFDYCCSIERDRDGIPIDTTLGDACSTRPKCGGD